MITKNHTIAFREMFDCLIGLYQEIASKCTPDERKDVKDKLSKARPFVNDLRLWVKAKDRQSCGNQDQDPKTKTPFLELPDRVEETLFDVEELVRDLLDKHGFSTLDAENTEGDQYA